MLIKFTSRDKARAFAAARKNNGFPAVVKDAGKQAAKRFAVDIKGQA